MMEETEKWAKSDVDVPVSILIDYLAERLKAPEINAKIVDIIKNCEKKWSEQSSLCIKSALMDEAENLFYNNVPDYITNFTNKSSDLGGLSLDFDSVVNSICNSLASGISTLVVKFVLFIIGVALIATIYGAPIGIAIIYFSDDIAEGLPATNKELSKPRNAASRTKIAKKMKERLKGNNDISKKVADSLKENLDKNGTFNEEELKKGLKESAKSSLESLLLKFDDEEI